MDHIYGGKSLLVTGGTGFCGKVFLEKILRCVPSIGHVYLLIRPVKPSRRHKAHPSEQASEQSGDLLSGRLHDLFASSVFDRLRASERLDGLKPKVIAVAGDMKGEYLGLSEEDRAMLRRSVDLVVNFGAAVEFFDTLDSITEINCCGPLKLLEFAQSCDKRPGFVHVSTAYVSANISGSAVPEKIPTIIIDGDHVDPEAILKTIMNARGQPNAKRLYKRLLSSSHHPNTYTFSKALGEILLARRHGSTPLTILRPSVVGSSLIDPVPGWSEQVGTITTVVMAGGLGLVHEVPGKADKVLDIIPVDLLANAVAIQGAVLLFNAPSSKAVMLDNNENNKADQMEILPSTTMMPPLPPLCAADFETEDVRVVHLTSSSLNPARHSNLLSSFAEEFSPFIPEHMLKGSVHFKFTKSSVLHAKLLLAKHVLVPGMRNLCLLMPHLTERSIKIASHVRKSDSVLRQYEVFMVRQWSFESTMADLTKSPALSNSDRVVFNTDPAEISWPMYLKNMADGILKYIMKVDEAPRPILVTRKDIASTLGLFDDPHVTKTCDVLVTNDAAFTLPGSVIASLRAPKRFSHHLANELRFKAREAARKLE
mmetsp:Transcript_31551/g.50920  ORF Transcript_31551/g.50920 Transcript_31551/m.50920 type:complete len:596 (-) Transcript_31551:63-1850(-)|eukprot:CAMPEP_0184673206 /NCGR_PEP_ID=MMETSP0308-20130426/86549_1 /TAXON_ID=38269 /ORGANISM="Gloeochaete witrockiana, Strain SAG 46.84" /LENGTH=595 /DNA_ID=CAMNT_0027120663 /DNA_START=128 /DNA_END=1915 /DNA_ORIENTATION=-